MIRQPYFVMTSGIPPVATGPSNLAGASSTVPPLQGALEMMAQGFSDRADLRRASARFSGDLPAFLAQKPFSPVPKESRADLAGASLRPTAAEGFKLTASDDETGAPKSLQPVQSIAETKAPGPYDFVQVSIHGTPIDRFRENLGKDLIEYIKELLYSRLVHSYPELRNLPPEKFEEIFLFEFSLTWFQNSFGGGSVELFLSRSNIGYQSKYGTQISLLKSFFENMDTSEGSWQISTPTKRKPSELSWKQLLSLKSLKVSGKQMPDLLRRIAEASDFTYALNPGQLEIILSLRYPELQVYFHLDRLLKLAVQNPEALTEHLKEEILKAERSIQELLRRKEIEEREANDRIALLRAEMRELTERIDQSRRELVALEPAVADLKNLVEKLVFGGIVGLFEVRDTVENLELISLPDKKEEGALRQKAASFVRAEIASQLWTLLGDNREKWEKEKVGIQIGAQLVAHQRMGGFFRPIRDVFEFILTARVETPSHRSDLSVHASFEWDGGESNGARAILSTSVSDLMQAVEERTKELIVQENLLPRRRDLIGLLTDGGDMEDVETLRSRINEVLRLHRRT